MLPLPPDFAGVLADVEPDVETGLDAGGDDFFTLAGLLDGHGVLDGVAALDLAGWLTGGALELVPGSGGWVPLVGGDEESVGGAVMVGGGDELAGGGLVGLELVEPVPVVDLLGGAVVWQLAPGVTVAPAEWWLPPPVGLSLLAASEPGPLAPPPVPWWLVSLPDDPAAEEAELGDTTCGSSVRAKPPAATTKTAMPMPATGRIQLYRGRAWPGCPGAGRKRSTTAQKATTTGSIQRRNQAAAPADQADADSKDSIGRFSRSLIRSSPSADGSIESAAACRARRRASS